MNEGMSQESFSQEKAMPSVLVMVSITVKRHHDQSSSYKGKHSIGDGLQFKNLLQDHDDRKHDRVQADIVLERAENFIWILWQQKGRMNQ